MASNLRKKLTSSATLQVYDINSASCQRLVNEYSSYGKVEVASSPKDLTTKCRTVLTSLPSSASVREVFLNSDNGVIAASKTSDRLILECSTIEIETTKEIGQTIMDAGLGAFVDATVSGGMWGANEGTLSFMIGHAEPTEDDVVSKRIFETLSLVGLPNKLQFCGSLGMGQVAKIAHNYVSLANNLVAAEGMALGLRYGIDKKALWKCMTDGTANSWVMHLEQPVPGLVDEAPSSNGYRRAFAARLSLKDLRIAVNSARRVGLDPTAGEAAIRMFEKVDNDPRTTVSSAQSYCCHSDYGKIC